MSGYIENQILVIKNPITDKDISRLDISSSMYVADIIAKAKQYKGWSSLSLNKRCSNINKLRKAIVKNKDELQNILKSETGKKDFDVFVELFGLLEHLKEITKIAKKSLKPNSRNAGTMKSKKAYVIYNPLGVAGVISPWNYPLTTPITSISEALLAGNNVILKPSEHTPLTALFIKKLWDEFVGYEDAFNIIIGAGDVGQMLVNSKDIDIICFTGSTKVGKLIAEKCSETLKPVILELGGKDPLIVLKDANLKRAVESALFAGYSNAGQTCISVEEVFVEDVIYERFVKDISSKVRSMSAGFEDNMEIGSMIMESNCNKVREHISEINQNKIISGKSINHKMYIAPTIIIEPPEESRVVNEETFGPLISIRSFKDKDELLSKIHKTGYGLAGSIFGKDKKRINEILNELKIGNISINDVFTHYGIASLPFGGEGLSGLGRMHGKEGLRSLCRVTSVVENRFNFISEPWWFSRPKFIEKVLKKVLVLLYR